MDPTACRKLPNRYKKQYSERALEYQGGWYTPYSGDEQLCVFMMARLGEMLWGARKVGMA